MDVFRPGRWIPFYPNSTCGASWYVSLVEWDLGREDGGGLDTLSFKMLVSGYLQDRQLYESWKLMWWWFQLSWWNNSSPSFLQVFVLPFLYRNAVYLVHGCCDFILQVLCAGCWVQNQFILRLVQLVPVRSRDSDQRSSQGSGGAVRHWLVTSEPWIHADTYVKRS